jgi:hypothetical protein
MPTHEPRVIDDGIFVNIPLDAIGSKNDPVADSFGPLFRERDGARLAGGYSGSLGHVWRIVTHGDQWAIGEGQRMVHGGLNSYRVWGRDTEDLSGDMTMTIYERSDGYATAFVHVYVYEVGFDVSACLRRAMERILGSFVLVPGQVSLDVSLRLKGWRSDLSSFRWYPESVVVLKEPVGSWAGGVPGAGA